MLQLCFGVAAALRRARRPWQQQLQPGRCGTLLYNPARTLDQAPPPTRSRSYPNVYVFRFHNMRNEKFKELRDELKDSSR